MVQKTAKRWLIFIGLIFIIALLNPTYSNFKEFTGFSGKKTEHLHKKYNFLVCSIYENNYNDKKYFATLMNFIEITPKKLEIPDTTWSHVDTMKRIVDSSFFVDDTTNSSSLPPLLRKKIPSYREVKEVNYVDVSTLIAKSRKPIFVDSATFVNSIISDDELRAFGIVDEYGIPIRK